MRFTAFPSLDSSTTETRANRIVRGVPRPLALEARFMFDGAAAAEIAAPLVEPVASADAMEPVELAAAQVPEVTLFVVPATSADPGTARLPDTVTAALALAQQQVRDFLARTDANALFSLFNGGQEHASAQWLEAAQALRTDILEGRYGVRVELVGDTLGWAMGAFAAQGPDGSPVIYLNADWVRGETSASDVARVLVEEVGHSIDNRLNPMADTAGDEGELFAATVLSVAGPTDMDRAQLQQQDDHSVIEVAGHDLQVETATESYTIQAVYSVVASAGGITSEIDPEQNIHLFNTAAVAGTTSITYDTGFKGVPGNNVVVKLEINGTSYWGWMSRVIVDSSNKVAAFYFWSDPTFNNFKIATDSAGNDPNAKVKNDNIGFLLVVDVGTFTSCIESIANTTEFKQVGSNSRPVDAVFSTLITNTPPVATADSASGFEDFGPITGNVLTNDTDINSDALSVTGFSIQGVSGTFSPSSTAITIPDVGSLTLGSDGTYTFVPVANYNGLVPVITYTVYDGKGGAASATLTITVNPVNDAPIASNNAVTVLEDGIHTFSSTDFGFTDASDTPANTLLNVVITSPPTPGTLRYDGNIVALTDGSFTVYASDILAGKLTFTPVPNAHGNAYARFTFQVQDSGGTSNEGVDTSEQKTLTINVTSVNDAPENKTPEALRGFNNEPLQIPGLSVADIDGEGAIQTVTVSVVHGTLVAQSPDAGSRSGTEGTREIILTGTIAQINAKLATLSYLPDAGYVGPETLTLHTVDVGEAFATSQVQITVAEAPSTPLQAQTPPPYARSSAGLLLPPLTTNPIVIDAALRGHTPQVFDSALHPQAQGNSAQTTYYIEPPASASTPSQRALALWAFNDMFTDAPPDNWRIVVHPDTGDQIAVLRGVPDQAIAADGVSYVSVPWDSFFHTQSDARVTLNATLTDGSPLPAWVHLNPETGTFELVPPPGFQGELAIRLQARDAQGKEAATVFRINVGERTRAQPGDGVRPARAAFSDQLREATRPRASDARAALHPA